MERETGFHIEKCFRILSIFRITLTMERKPEREAREKYCTSIEIMKIPEDGSPDVDAFSSKDIILFKDNMHSKMSRTQGKKNATHRTMSTSSSRFELDAKCRPSLGGAETPKKNDIIINNI